MTIKHPQTILAVDAEQVCTALNLQQGFNAVSYEEFLDVLQSALITRQRDYLDNRITTKADVVAQLSWYADLHGIELNFPNLSLVPEFKYKGDRRFLQLLPYRVVIESHDDGKRIALYQRGEGGGEVRLLDAISCGYGGHPDLVDLLSPKVTNAESFRESHGLYASFNFGTTAEDFANSLLVCIPDGSRAEIHHD